MSAFDAASCILGGCRRFGGSRGVAEQTFDPERILEALVRHAVDFVVVGGLAGIAHGSAYNTEDVDVAYDRSEENLRRLISFESAPT